MGDIKLEDLGKVSDSPFVRVLGCRCTLPPLLSNASTSLAARCRLRTVPMALWPCSNALSAICRPKPDETPVTNQTEDMLAVVMLLS